MMNITSESVDIASECGDVNLESSLDNSCSSSKFSGSKIKLSPHFSVYREDKKENEQLKEGNTILDIKYKCK